MMSKTARALVVGQVPMIRWRKNENIDDVSRHCLDAVVLLKHVVCINCLSQISRLQYITWKNNQITTVDTLPVNGDLLYSALLRKFTIENMKIFDMVNLSSIVQTRGVHPPVPFCRIGSRSPSWWTSQYTDFQYYLHILQSNYFFDYVDRVTLPLGASASGPLSASKIQSRTTLRSTWMKIEDWEHRPSGQSKFRFSAHLISLISRSILFRILRSEYSLWKSTGLWKSIANGTRAWRGNWNLSVELLGILPFHRIGSSSPMIESVRGWGMMCRRYGIIKTLHIILSSPSNAWTYSEGKSMLLTALRTKTLDKKGMGIWSRFSARHKRRVKTTFHDAACVHDRYFPSQLSSG